MLKHIRWFIKHFRRVVVLIVWCFFNLNLVCCYLQCTCSKITLHSFLICFVSSTNCIVNILIAIKCFHLSEHWIGHTSWFLLTFQIWTCYIVIVVHWWHTVRQHQQILIVSYSLCRMDITRVVIASILINQFLFELTHIGHWCRNFIQTAVIVLNVTIMQCSRVKSEYSCLATTTFISDSCLVHCCTMRVFAKNTPCTFTFSRVITRARGFISCVIICSSIFQNKLLVVLIVRIVIERVSYLLLTITILIVTIATLNHHWFALSSWIFTNKRLIINRLICWQTRGLYTSQTTIRLRFLSSLINMKQIFFWTIKAIHFLLSKDIIIGLLHVQRKLFAFNKIHMRQIVIFALTVSTV